MNIFGVIKLHRKLRIEQEMLTYARIDYRSFGYSYDSFKLNSLIDSIDQDIKNIEKKYPFLSWISIYKTSKICKTAKYKYINLSAIQFINIFNGKWDVSIKITIWHFFNSTYSC